MMLVDNPWQARPTSTAEASLSVADLPPIYEKAFRSCNPQRGRVTLSALKMLLALDGLPPSINEQIINLCISPGDTSISRNTFKLALAMVALAQKNMDPSLDNVMVYIGDLPAPSLPGLDSLYANLQRLELPSSDRVEGIFGADSRSMPYLADPWKSHGVEDINPMPSSLGGDSYLNAGDQVVPLAAPTPGLKDTFASYNSAHNVPRDMITIQPHDQLEGFLFKHINYVVTSERFKSRVLRRYSEFHALYCYFVEKYPYRLIPEIPPKRLGVNDEFLEKRRKGLLRFMTFVSNHPVLGADEQFRTFLIDAELTGKFRAFVQGRGKLENEERGVVARTQEATQHPEPAPLKVPQNLELQLDNLLINLKIILQHYNAMIAIVGRLARRAYASSADLAELSQNRPPPRSRYAAALASSILAKTRNMILFLATPISPMNSFPASCYISRNLA